jgi:hypothetical protein
VILPATQELRRSLASVEADERIRVRSILFSLLRDDCARIGLREGDELVCKRASAAVLVLLSDDGRPIVMDRDRARFIEVSALEPAR